MNKEQNQEIEVNLIIQSFQEKISQLTTEVVIKEATIRQLTNELEKIKQSLNNNQKEQ